MTRAEIPVRAGARGRGERLAASWDDFWFRPEPATQLGACRIIFYLGLYWLLFIDGDFLGEVLFNTSLPEPFHFPQGIFKYLPVAAPDTMQLLSYVLAVALLLAAAGLMTRAAAVVAFVLLFYMEMQSNYGKVIFIKAVPIITLGILMLSRAGDALSVDNLVRRRWARWPFGARAAAPSGEYRWPLQLIRVYVCLVFFMAGVSKLHASGLHWVFSDNLAILLVANPENQGCLGAWPKFPAIGQWAADQVALLRVMAAGVIALELLAPLALIPGLIRFLMVGGFLLLNLGFRFTLGPQFNELILVYLCFFIPWASIAPFLQAKLRRSAAPRRIDEGNRHDE